MKRLNLRNFTIIAVAVTSFIACNPLKKMSQYSNNITYEVNPDPLTAKGDSVEFTISAKFPPAFFHKLVTMTAKPVLKNSNGEVVKEFKELKMIGNEADGDGQKVDFTNGGTVSYTDKVPYHSSMKNVTMTVTGVAGFKTKTQEFETVKIADGTITTAMMVQTDPKPILAKDKFVKIIPRSINADINYLIQQSNVRSSELSTEDMKALEAFVKNGVENEFSFKGVNISAYASPDGELTKNDELANNRAKSASAAVKKILKKYKVKAAENDGFIVEAGKGEDWAGFQKAMNASDIKDKELILRILGMYNDNEKRETEIKNLAATYVEVANNILPQLRRSMITINAEEVAKTDEEIMQLTKSDSMVLSIEELLYAATLTENIDEKLRIYTLAKTQYPKDWRGFNNVGYIYVMKNDMKNATSSFNAAAAISENNIVSNNMGVCMLFDNDVLSAKTKFNAATGAGNEVNYNKGIIAIKQGEYDVAVGEFGSEKSFNTALANHLNGDNDAALQNIDNSDAKDSAEGYYLKAIVGAKTSNNDMVINNLKSAIAKDASLKSVAANDAEFVEYRDEDAFIALTK